MAKAKGRRKAARGEVHGMARLSQEQVLEIRRLADAGISRAEICKRFGISKTCVRLIIVRKTWRHL